LTRRFDWLQSTSTPAIPQPDATTVITHRFEEIINGHTYLIEVSEVDPQRWRAFLVRRPGGPTALMPFYGATPDEAARQLSEWLTRAHRAAVNSV